MEFEACIVIIWVAIILHYTLLPGTTQSTNKVQFAMGFHSVEI